MYVRAPVIDIGQGTCVHAGQIMHTVYYIYVSVCMYVCTVCMVCFNYMYVYICVCYISLL